MKWQHLHVKEKTRRIRAFPSPPHGRDSPAFAQQPSCAAGGDGDGRRGSRSCSLHRSPGPWGRRNRGRAYLQASFLVLAPLRSADPLQRGLQLGDSGRAVTAAAGEVPSPGGSLQPGPLRPTRPPSGCSWTWVGERGQSPSLPGRGAQNFISKPARALGARSHRCGAVRLCEG